MIEREPKIKKIEQSKNEAWEKLEKSPDKNIREMIRRGILSLDKIGAEEIRQDKQNGRNVTLKIRRKENGAFKEKITNYPRSGFGEQTEKLIYEFDNGVTLHFEKFLPEGWKLRQSTGGGFATFDGLKSMYYGNLRDEENPALILLHEIGHVICFDRQKREDPEGYRKTMRIYGEAQAYCGVFSEAERKEMARTIARTERDAFAEALKIIRVLKNNGLVFKREDYFLGDLDEEMSKGLATYKALFPEAEYFYKLDRLSDKEVMALSMKFFEKLNENLRKSKQERKEDRKKVANEIHNS